MKTTILLTMGLVAVAPLAGCASMVNGTTCKVTITSKPDEAEIAVVNSAGKTVFNGSTPAEVKLKRGKGYFQGEDYTVRFTKPGCQPTEMKLSKHLSGWYFGNIAFGGLIGMLIVDPLTGGMWTLDENVCGELGMLPTSCDPQGALHIVCLNDVPDEARKHLRTIR